MDGVDLHIAQAEKAKQFSLLFAPLRRRVCLQFSSVLVSLNVFCLSFHPLSVPQLMLKPSKPNCAGSYCSGHSHFSLYCVFYPSVVPKDSVSSPHFLIKFIPKLLRFLNHTILGSSGFAPFHKCGNKGLRSASRKEAAAAC